jgi:hypothetical protein
LEFHFFVQVELLIARSCDLIAARNPELLSRALRLVVGIAFSGAQRRIQPHGLLEPGGTCVETSDDVIAIIFRNTAAGCQALKSNGIDMARQHYADTDYFSIRAGAIQSRYSLDIYGAHPDITCRIGQPL